MKATVYIESTIVSYLVAKPSRDLIVAAHQQLTMEWWDLIRLQVDCFVSPFVIQEISAGDEEAANKRIGLIKDMPVLVFKKEEKYVAVLPAAIKQEGTSHILISHPGVSMAGPVFMDSITIPDFSALRTALLDSGLKIRRVSSSAKSRGMTLETSLFK